MNCLTGYFIWDFLKGIVCGMQITDTVYPMYKAFIEPDLNTAHLKIYNTFNPFSGFMAPTYILKSAKTVGPEAIKAVLKVGPCCMTS